MTNLPSGEQFPYLDLPSLQALREDHERLKYLTGHELGRLRHFMNELNESGGYRVGTISTTLQARSDGPPIVPGGPVDFQPYKFDGTNLVTDGSAVPLYSWVKTPSADPADQPGGVLWVAAGRDDFGTHWFAAQDCTEAPVELINVTGTNVDPIPASPGASLGLGFTVQDDDPGIWQLTGGVTIDSSLVGNNQDIGVRVFATLGGVEVGQGITTWFFKSSGAVFDVPFTLNFTLENSDPGEVFDIRVERLSGQTTLAAVDPSAQYLGPF